MANFINKIKIGNAEYNIGMANAIHFEGTALVGTWFSDEACTTAATVADLKKDFLYYNAAKIGDATVEPGCMYLPLDGTANTGYELVCVELADGISKWSVLGKVKQSTKDITTSVTTAAVNVVGSISTSDANFVNAVTADSKAAVVGSLSTANVNVITSAPGTASATGATAVNSVVPTATSINNVTKINAGDVVADHITSANPVSAIVSGGGVEVKTGDKEVTVNEASAVMGAPAITLNASEKTLATGVSATTTAAVKSTDKDDFNTAATYKVENATLILPISILTAAATANYVTSVAAQTATVNVPTEAKLASNSVVTAITASPVTKTISGVVTGATHTNPTVTLPTAVVTGVTYTAPTLESAAQSVVTSVAVSSTTIYGLSSGAKVITNVPYAATTVATGAASTVSAVTGLTVGSAKAVVSVASTAVTVNSVTSQNTGTVVTAAE